ncbi:MAG: iron-containing alcohol dehydrogenase [Rhodospirillales bacterium]|nr:MAG: iron-containing alcohol dehydrogenase [Rhodospirillales bacterium]
MTIDAAAVTGNWNYPTKMIVGPGRIAKLAAACRSQGMRRPLLVTDPGIAALPMVVEAIALCEEAGLSCGLFSDVKGNPVGRNVTDGVHVFREGDHDGVIAFGGGSALDAAKAVALMVGQDRPIWEFEDVGDNWKRVNAAGIAPVVAVPTTAGTGSEVGRASVITNEQTHEKKIIFHPAMLPGVVILDAQLTVGLPPHITAATGLDAFVHCFEAYCAPFYHPMADGIALEGMRLIGEFLPRAHADGSDLVARSQMLVAASMGATAFQKGLGAVHAIAHAVGAMYDTHHGLTNAVLLPYVMQFNRAAIESRMGLLARMLELDGDGYGAVLDWLLAVRRDLGIPETLAALDVPEADAEAVGRLAASDPSAGGNPRPVTAADMTAVFRAAHAGDL